MTGGPLTLAALLEHLSQIAENAAPDTLVTINGEVVERLSLTLQNPIARYAGGYGPAEMARDPLRSEVLDLSINGREAPRMPVGDYPFHPVPR